MKGLLGSILAEPRQDADRTRWDYLLVLAVLIGAAGSDAGLLASLAVVVPLALCAWFRKTVPLVACLGGFAVALVASRTVDPGRDASILGLIVLSYALGRWAAGRNVLIGLATILLVGRSVSSAEADFALGTHWAAEAVASVMGSLMESTMWLVPFGFGVAVRSRAAAHARDVTEARSKERAELARELHDTVAHHVSVIAVQAQAGQAVAPVRPDGAVEALEAIENEATRTLDEMRRMVRALRAADEQAATAPQADVRQIEALAEPAGDPPVRVEIRGDVESLSPTVGASLFRIAQEATTNARRHARGARHIDITVDANGEEIHLTVSDDGRKPANAGDSAGFGLEGMAERVALLNGRFAAAPGKERGWVVEATLPRVAAGA